MTQRKTRPAAVITHRNVSIIAGSAITCAGSMVRTYGTKRRPHVSHAPANVSVWRPGALGGCRVWVF